MHNIMGILVENCCTVIIAIIFLDCVPVQGHQNKLVFGMAIQLKQ